MAERDPLAERKADLAHQKLMTEEITRLLPVALEILAATKEAEVHIEQPGLVMHIYPPTEFTEQ